MTGLQVPPKQAAKLSGPFAKAADGKKQKQKKKKGRALLLENEEKLHEYIRDVVLPSLESSDSSYFERKTRFENRRNNAIKKIQREARMETLAAQRTVDAGYASLRSSTRLRRGARVSNGYDESARDVEIEAAIRESERNARKRRKRSGSEDSDEEYDDVMDLDETRSQSEEDQFDEGDEEHGNSRRQRRAAGRNGASSSSRATIPGERRSARRQLQTYYREPTPEAVASTSSRKASIVRGESADFEVDEEKEEAPFGGLEEVWSMGRYRGYYRPDRTFIKAQKGDIPLYKLAKMGLPLPPLTGPIPGASSSSTTASQAGSSSTFRSMADRIAAINGEEARTSTNAARPGNGSMGTEAEDVSMPGSAVPTLIAETDGRDTDDSNVLADGMDEDDDDADSAIVTVSSRAKPQAEPTNGSSAKTALASSSPEKAAERSMSKGSPRNTSHIQVIV